MASQSMPARNAVALLLIGMMLINPPGVVTALTQSPGIAAESRLGSLLLYPIALLATVYLLSKHLRPSSISIPYLLFLTFFLAYLVSSFGYSLINGDLNDFDLIVLVMYSFQLLFISAIYMWVAQLKNEELDFCFRFSKRVLLITSLSIIFSPLLPHYQGNSIDRAGGFLIDQNAAAFAALYCLILVASYPSKRSLIALTEAGIAIAALILTFSRTGFLVFIILCILYLFSRGSIKELVFATAGLTAFILAMFILLHYELVHLSFENRQRLHDVAAILTGESVQKTYDQRDTLFELGLQRISENLPWGAGIGKFHEMEYGVRNPPTGRWLGVHNTYLLILGEAGLAGFVPFVAFWITLTWKIARSSSHRALSIGLTIVLLSSMMTTHAVFNYKISAVMLSFVIALASRASSERRNDRPFLNHSAIPSMP